MLRLISAALAGGLFGAGLLISGMTDTAKVQGWLDVFGNWDPTLAFVMGGAIIPMAIAWALTKKRTPLFAESFPAPPSNELGSKLILGSVLFGMGWGLVGLCPGPSMASLSYGGPAHWIFFVAMLAGMLWAPNARQYLDRAVAA